MRAVLRLAMAMTAIAAATAGRAASLPLLPMPAHVATGQGRFVLRGAMLHADPDDIGAVAAAARFSDLLRRSGGPRLGRMARMGAGQGGIRFVRDESVMGDEAYRLDITPTGAMISASGDAGLYYGAETLWQLAASADRGRIAAVQIEDSPTFAWRGLMLDSARHFQPVDYIKQLLDRMAAEKLNIFHWHLTDDQGWRIEIKRYPRLTDVGAWRTPAGAEGRDPQTGQPVRYGGYYTQDQIRDVVAYAAARHITIMPEIEMPGHATAAIAAYPELASTTTPPTAPTSDWGVLPNLFNTQDSTFVFLDNVLDEVMALFPGRYVHVGGDEAPKEQWATDEHARARVAELGFSDVAPLQGWFTARIGDYLEKHGRRLVGWDEILEGGVPADAAVMSWRGMDGAINAARSGHDTILSPAPILYLDNRQSDSPDEPPGRGEIVDWKRLYAFETAPPSLTPEERRHIIGLQANLWTEHVRTTDYADRMIWPRGAILAELGWSPASTRDWAGFGGRLLADMGRARALGWHYDETPLEPEAALDAGGVTLRQPARIGLLRYTTSGNAPTAASPVYAAPIPIGGAHHVAAQSFLDGVAVSGVRRWSFSPASLLSRSAPEMQQCATRLPLRLEDDGATDGVRRVHWVDVMRPCWEWPAAKLDGIASISAEVGSVPYNFALGADIAQVTFRPPEMPEGEMEVRQDRCDGPRIAVVPLAPAAGHSGVTTLTTPLAGPVSGMHDLCITFTQKTPDPLWVLDRLTLHPMPPR